MCNKALPSYYHKTAKGTGTDFDNPFQGWIRKSWLAYGPRATCWFHKWRELPKVLFALGDAHKWRLEYTDASLGDCLTKYPKKPQPRGFYLSTIQYWKRWGVVLQWPFHITAHIYFREADVPTYPDKPGKKTDGKLFFFRIGARRDADRVYWFPSVFVGGSWN